ncbi:MAG: rhodanese-like domain-containing protein [Candidatus Hodarchaeota archaeon]
MTLLYYLKAVIRYWKKTLYLLRNLDSDEWSEITVDALLDRINSDQPPVLIDVRSASEFNSAEGYIPNAIPISIFELASKLEDLQEFKEKEIVTICKGGGLSLVAVDVMVEAGFKDVKSLHGGMDLWYQRGYPTTTS